jgi:hypothetical protein
MTPIIAIALVALFLALGVAAVADAHARHCPHKKDAK